MIVDTEAFNLIVARFMKVDDITMGEPKSGYLVRYRGQLYGDSEQAYNQLSSQLKQYHITPLFRKDNQQHAVLLVDGIIQPNPSNPLVNLLLFAVTVVSVMFAGALYTYNGPEPTSTSNFILNLLKELPSGIPFAVSMLSILLAHEFGHYLAGRYHHTHVTLPYFIPLPISPLGTMGAFIQLKEPPKNKRILLDIGIAGPIAGLLVAIPVLLYGLSLSRVEPILVAPGQAIQLEGNSLLYLLSKFIVFGKLLPAPSSFNGIPPLLYWIRYFFTSQPAPIGGMDVIINPIAWAGWAGLLVTALNLIPAGQLDGGHLIYVLLGKKARMLWPFILVALVLLGFFWSGWWLWALIIFLLGRIYAEPLDQVTQLDPRRKVLAVIGLILFFLVFTPVPLLPIVVSSL